jgi:4'-phosphopantetheinyl transferase
LSLSHSHGRAISVVAEGGCALGCDIERIEPRSAAFISSYFTLQESTALEAIDKSSRNLLANLIWSAKESALKALRQGLRTDTRSMEVVAVNGGSAQPWARLEVTPKNSSSVLVGRWRRLDDFVLTIISRPAPSEIVDLG